MATETLDDKKPEEEEVKDKENEEGSKEVLEKQMEVEEKENEEEEEEEDEEEKREEEEEESEDEGTKKVKGSSRKGSSRKSGRDSAEKKEPVTPSSDRPTRERKVVERVKAWVHRLHHFRPTMEKWCITQDKWINGANGEARVRSAGSTARTSGPSAGSGSNTTSLRWDRHTIQFSVNAWVFIVVVLAIFPLVPKSLSNRAYQLSFLYTLCMHYIGG